MKNIYKEDNNFGLNIDDNDLQDLRLKRLVLLTKYISYSCPFYKNLFLKNKINPSNIKSLREIEKLPFTYPEDVRVANLEFKTESKISQVLCSGGTSGKPKKFFWTNEDLLQMFERSARSFHLVGINKSDIVAILQPFGIWGIGNDYMRAVELIGATVLPLGINLNDIDVIRLIKELGVTVILCAPANLCRLTSYIRENQKNSLKKEFKVKKIITSGEKLANEQRNFLANSWNAEVFDLFGSAETGTLGGECKKHCGIHLWSDHFLFEIVNPITGETVENGKNGELVISTLVQYGTPLLRYRSGDIARRIIGKCGCGINYPLFKVLGRISESIVLKEGTKLFSYQVEEILGTISNLTTNYQVIAKDVKGKDQLTFLIETKKINRRLESEILEKIENLSIDFTDAIRSGIVMKPKVELLKHLTLKINNRGKVIKFIDKRKNTLG